MPRSTIKHQWNHDGVTVAWWFRVLVGELLAGGGGWWLPCVCGLGALCEVMLLRLFVECWFRLVVVLHVCVAGVRQCLPLLFCWCPRWLVVCVQWLPLWRVAMGAVVLL